MYFIRALQYCVAPSGTAHCCAMNTSALSPCPELPMPVLLGESDNCSFKGKLIWLVDKHSFLVPVTKGKYAAWEDGRQRKGIWRWISGESFLTMSFEARSSCNGDPNHTEIPCLLLSVESVGTLLGSRLERNYLALRWVPRCGAMYASANVAPYLSLPVCRENPVSCNFFCYFRFWLFLDTFDFLIAMN